MEKKWLIYGAYGYTGKLIVREALKIGKNPILAGRNDIKLLNLANEFDLKYKLFELDDIDEISENLMDIDIVFNLAGPYSKTSDILIQACLKTQTHYLDLSGDIDIYQNAYSYNEEAKAKGISIICGVGFNVIVTEAAALIASESIKEPSSIMVAIAAMTKPSSGTFKQTMEILPKGGREIRDGVLKSSIIGEDRRFINYGDFSLMSYSIPMGELPVIQRSTNVKNIKAYLSLSNSMSTSFDFFNEVVTSFASKRYGRVILKKFANAFINGPSEEQNTNGKSYVWASAESENGDISEVIIQTPKAYYFTALLALGVLNEFEKKEITGALTPAQAFGKDFIKQFKNVNIVTSDTE
jgi:short subunit dehydrogenase-like uncharacterized protein